MAGTAVLGRLRRVPWQPATVREVVAETPGAATIVLDVDGWTGHRAGQHVDVRLTAEDGYQAQRSYSIASAPEAGVVELTVERIDDGEVSPYLVDELRPGDSFEVRGPIGGHFTWSADEGGPLLLIAGGSGLVPLMSMLRHRAARGAAVLRGRAGDARTARGSTHRPHLHAPGAARLDRVEQADRRGDDRRRHARRGRARLRLRADVLRRARERPARRGRPRPARDP